MPGWSIFKLALGLNLLIGANMYVVKVHQVPPIKHQFFAKNNGTNFKKSILQY